MLTRSWAGSCCLPARLAGSIGRRGCAAGAATCACTAIGCPNTLDSECPRGGSSLGQDLRPLYGAGGRGVSILGHILTLLLLEGLGEAGRWAHQTADSGCVRALMFAPLSSPSWRWRSLRGAARPALALKPRRLLVELAARRDDPRNRRRAWVLGSALFLTAIPAVVLLIYSFKPEVRASGRGAADLINLRRGRLLAPSFRKRPCVTPACLPPDYSSRHAGRRRRAGPAGSK